MKWSLVTCGMLALAMWVHIPFHVGALLIGHFGNIWGKTMTQKNFLFPIGSFFTVD